MSAEKQSARTGKGIGTVEDLLAHARTLEMEAAERYSDLADQMEVHNNLEVAGLFRKMAEIEGKHIDAVGELSAGKSLPELKAWEFDWGDQAESPEAIDISHVHYLMQPYHAISLALRHEEYAVAFFEYVASQASDEELRALAEQLAEEEREHVVLLGKWLERFPEPEEGWDEDPDPPSLQE